MGNLKRQIVHAWLDEQYQAGGLSLEEFTAIKNCDNVTEWVRQMIKAVGQTGDTTPLEILAGDYLGGDHFQNSYS